jgi:N-acetylmuramoyl-L-alanine amidase
MLSVSGRTLRRSCLAVACALCASLATASSAANPVIAVDVGHSLLALGATSARGIPEFQYNLNLARVVLNELATQGVTTVPVGMRGDMVDLSQRTAQAAADKANFFLSIHHDSVQPQYLQRWEWLGKTASYSDRFSGFSLFVSRRNGDPATSLRCASAIGAALRHAGMRPSPHHAEAIHGENRHWVDELNGVYYFDDLVVLKTATMPAVLLEAGVIVNRDEEQLVRQPTVQTMIAKAVVQGLTVCGIIPGAVQSRAH